MPVIGHGVEICTSTTRPTTGIVAGTLIYETDTNLMRVYNGSSWVTPMNGHSVGGDLEGTYPDPIIDAEWAAKGGPNSYISAYKNTFALQAGNGTHLNWTTYNYGILVNTTGYYECRAGQRIQNGADAYIGIGINGDRTALENRTTGIWSHNHAGYNNLWTESYYIGLLNANEIITVGPPASTSYLLYAALGYAGFLSIKYLGR